MKKLIVILGALIALGVSQVAVSGESLMDLDDIKLDAKSLVGKTVKVKAQGMLMADMFMISKGDMNSIAVDTSRVPREQRKKILQKCADIMTPCNVTVTGVVGIDLMDSVEIFAVSVEQ